MKMSKILAPLKLHKNDNKEQSEMNMGSLKEAAEEIIKKVKDETNSEAHKLFRSYPGHAATKQASRDLKKAEGDEDTPLPGISAPAATGVIFVMDRAFANGFTYDSPDWANFGQGAPEVGEIPGCAPRITNIDLASYGDGVNEYAPTTGVKALREAVANYYNETFRKDKESKYTYENICIVPGGRAGLTRVAAVIGDVLVSYSLPEYTAYDQMLSVFKRMVPIPSALSAEDDYRLNIKNLHDDIKSMGLSVVVASNPKNPTGQAVEGEELEHLLKMAKAHQTTVILDEFYSWYSYEGELGTTLSAASYIENVNEDPVILIDGLTKNWRLPGWRCCWVVAPKSIVSALGQSGSFIDGGASHPIQMAAIKMLDLKRVEQDRLALQKHFRMKREHVLTRLEKMGLKVKCPPKWTFYIWLDLSGLPAPLNSGLVFFEELLKEKCIVVPGLFFDINPSHRRNLFDSPCHHFVRLSFGPPLAELDKGLDAFERVLAKVNYHMETHGHLDGLGKDLMPHSPTVATTFERSLIH